MAAGARRTARLSHYDRRGRVRQVDVGDKDETRREAVAEGFVRVGARALAALRAGRLAKGDPLEIARIAGIQAAKRSAELIPLCHPIALTFADVEVAVRKDGIALRATARARGQTGVEMEALTAVAVAALTIYDMLKAADQAMRIEGVRLVRKSGGRSGDYVAPE